MICGLAVMDEDTCMVDVSKFFLEFTQRSLGKCSCEGTKQMLLMLQKICDGEDAEDLDARKLAYVLKKLHFVV